MAVAAADDISGRDAAKRNGRSMRRALVLILIILLLVQPVSALELTAPEAPEDAQGLMPVQTESFAEGLWEII